MDSQNNYEKTDSESDLHCSPQKITYDSKLLVSRKKPPHPLAEIELFTLVPVFSCICSFGCLYIFNEWAHIDYVTSFLLFVFKWFAVILFIISFLGYFRNFFNYIFSKRGKPKSIHKKKIPLKAWRVQLVFLFFLILSCIMIIWAFREIAGREY
jgi:hypothetical protein